MTKTKLKLLIVLLIIGQAVLGQQKLPVIRASSDKVDIRDGNILKKGTWTIMPDVKPDIYITTNKNNNKVTFYTDVDSISFLIGSKKKYDFIILLNKDSAYTQILCVNYLDTLISGGKYNLNDNREITKFTYLSKDDTDLVNVRKSFRLDSIIGTGNEVSQILNLMHWVHNTFPHNGNIDVPKSNSLFEMMTICKNEHKTLNCGALASVLNNCYLSLGFKSRQVVCLPKDSTDFDCHSINAVYSNTLNKWLWIDPTNDAYVMNERGELLSIDEVRDYLINNKFLILSPEANWNHLNSRTKDEYLYKGVSKN